MSTLVINAPGSSVVVPRPRKSWLLGLIAVLVAAAAFPNLRIDLGGLQVPLHVVPLMIAVPTALRRWPRVPAQVRAWSIVFLTLFSASVLRYGSDFGDLVKMITSVITVFTVAALVRNKTDFLAGVFGLAVALIVINARGISGGITANVGYQPLSGIANKNAYSIYSLPAVMMAAFALMHFRQAKWSMLVLAGSVLSSVFILFTGANRSGWGGIVLIGALLTIQARRWRALGVVVGLGVISYGVFTWFGSSEIFDYRLEQTTSGYESDDVRQNLLLAALEVGVENPVLGVTVQELPRELAKRTASSGDLVDPHNFIGYIAGGSGLFTLVALFALGGSLWRRPAQAMNPQLLLAHDLLRLVLILFVFRGMFSREVFTVAAFPIAAGLALGLSLADESENWSLVRDLTDVSHRR